MNSLEGYNTVKIVICDNFMRTAAFLSRQNLLSYKIIIHLSCLRCSGRINTEQLLLDKQYKSKQLGDQFPNSGSLFLCSSMILWFLELQVQNYDWKWESRNDWNLSI